MNSIPMVAAVMMFGMKIVVLKKPWHRSRSRLSVNQEARISARPS